MAHYLLHVNYDCDTESPNGLGWTLVPFTDGNLHEYLRHDRNGEVVAANVGLRRKLDAGTAFVLSCYRHGGESWKFYTDGGCKWDTQRYAGILLGDSKVLPSGRGARIDDAARFLEIYNQWVNGETYWYRLEPMDDDGVEDICGGFIGMDDLLAGVGDVLRHGDTYTVADDSVCMV